MAMNMFKLEQRGWIRTTYGRNFRYKRHGHKFVLMSYNILAESLRQKHINLYSRHRAEFLVWSHRLECLKNEIFAVAPNILCLQEVQETHLMEIENALRSMNYAKPLYKKRTSDEYDDGCAIFYDPENFELLDHQYVEYYQPEVQMLDRCNVGIIAKLASKWLENIEFVVATTHLLYNPRRDDIRTAQLQILLAELDRHSVHSKTQEPLPIIITGDFNSLPYSMPHCLIHDGHIPICNNLPLRLGITDDCQHINRQKTADENVNCVDAVADTITNEYVQEHGIPHNTGALWHYFNLTSTIYPNETHALASTYQDRWVLVDYIYFTKYTRRTLGPLGGRSTYSMLQLLANYQLPTKQQCEYTIGPIPNAMYGSDHFALASEFVLLMR